MTDGLRPGDDWEAFLIGGQKAGFLHRRLREAPDGGGLLLEHTLVFKVSLRVMRFRHRYFFRDESGLPWHAYELEGPERSRARLSLSGGRLRGRAAGARVDAEIPADAIPTYGLHTLLVTLPLEPEAEIRRTALEDASGRVIGPVRLQAEGWQETELAGEIVRLWKVRQYDGEEPGNVYWLDESRRLRRAEWRGAESVRAECREEALAGLPKQVTRHAEA